MLPQNRIGIYGFVVIGQRAVAVTIPVSGEAPVVVRIGKVSFFINGFGIIPDGFAEFAFLELNIAAEKKLCRFFLITVTTGDRTGESRKAACIEGKPAYDPVRDCALYKRFLQV